MFLIIWRAVLAEPLVLPSKAFIFSRFHSRRPLRAPWCSKPRNTETLSSKNRPFQLKYSSQWRQLRCSLFLSRLHMVNMSIQYGFFCLWENEFYLAIDFSKWMPWVVQSCVFIQVKVENPRCITQCKCWRLIYQMSSSRYDFESFLWCKPFYPHPGVQNTSLVEKGTSWSNSHEHKRLTDRSSNRSADIGHNLSPTVLSLYLGSQERQSRYHSRGWE